MKKEKESKVAVTKDQSEKVETIVTEKPKKRRCDRHDATRVKVTPMARLMTYLKDREDADVYICKKVDCTNLIKYMKEKKVKEPDTTYFHAFVATIAKVIYNRPLLNRFIVNHNFYQRDDVVISFVAKVSFEDDAKELMTLMKVEPDYTIDDIRNELKKRVDKIREGGQNSSDDSLDILDKLPSWVLKFIVVPILKWMDHHDLLPRSLGDNLLYNSSVIVSNLGSIKCGAIYHNITDFGTNGILITIGDIHKEAVVMPDGSIEARDIVELGCTLDERIADGVYFSKAVNMMEYIITHPETLEEGASVEIKEKSNFKY